MAVTTTQTNKPLNPRGNDQSPKGYNRAELYSGKALDFDGVNDILTMPTALTSSLSTTSVTFVTNVKTDFATWSGTRDDAFSFAERGMILAFNGGNIYYYYRHQSSGWRNLQVPNANFKPQEWNQMVTTIDLNADTWKAYINGIEVATSDTYSDTAIAYDSNALTIGGQAGARFFDGQIAGFKIFNTALTAAQVADLYNNPEKVVPTGVDNTALKLWLPMQEGAGTTAYDGSGNGNHGTISGATYTHGIGAPVSQTAVIDWNKGTNYIQQSEALQAGSWGKVNVSVTANAATAPNGLSAADKVVGNNGSTTIVLTSNVLSTGTYTFSAFFKAAEYSKVSIRESQSIGQYASFDLSNGTILDSLSYTNGTISNVAITDYGDGWYRCSGTYAQNGGSLNLGIIPLPDSYTSGQPLGSYTGDGVSGVYAWGAQAEVGSTLGAYVRSNADGTAQTSPVLLPQGLTSGRDITGVNLFENVRKQGALNLDGDSWAEVHDNESIDLSDANASFEAWVYYDFTAATNHYIFNKLVSAGYRIRIEPSGNFGFYMSDGSNTFSDGGSFPLVADSWNHLVLTTDGTNFKRYINGTLADTDVAGTPLTSYANNDNLYIGSNQTPADYMPTQIAQPRIYNRALTAEEVARNYDAGKNIYTND